MKEINFIAGGMLGDFIHTLAVVKGICERENGIANIYLTDNLLYGGDIWRLGAKKAHEDLLGLMSFQPYINKFEVLSDSNDPYYNLNVWRNLITGDYFVRGTYCRSWSEFLASCYNYELKAPYKWLNIDTIDSDTKDKVVIHRSTHRHNPLFNWQRILSNISEEVVFLTCSQVEYDQFPFKSDKIKLKLVNTITEMAVCINSSKLFIGNQSAPFAIASALDVNRLVELREQESKFYMGESKYSENISWFLNDNEKHFTKQLEKWIQ